MNKQGADDKQLNDDSGESEQPDADQEYGVEGNVKADTRKEDQAGSLNGNKTVESKEKGTGQCSKPNLRPILPKSSYAIVAKLQNFVANSFPPVSTLITNPSDDLPVVVDKGTPAKTARVVQQQIHCLPTPLPLCQQQPKGKRKSPESNSCFSKNFTQVPIHRPALITLVPDYGQTLVHKPVSVSINQNNTLSNDATTADNSVRKQVFNGQFPIISAVDVGKGCASMATTTTTTTTTGPTTSADEQTTVMTSTAQINSPKVSKAKELLQSDTAKDNGIHIPCSGTPVSECGTIMASEAKESPVRVSCDAFTKEQSFETHTLSDTSEITVQSSEIVSSSKDDLIERAKSYRFASGNSQTPMYVSQDIVLSGGIAQQNRRRIIHNQVEKRRKEKINGWIGRIGELLFRYCPEKQSKNVILEKTYEFIQEKQAESQAKSPTCTCGKVNDNNNLPELVAKIAELENLVKALLQTVTKHKVPVPYSVKQLGGQFIKHLDLIYDTSSTSTTTSTVVIGTQRTTIPERHKSVEDISPTRTRVHLESISQSNSLPLISSVMYSSVPATTSSNHLAPNNRQANVVQESQSQSLNPSTYTTFSIASTTIIRSEAPILPCNVINSTHTMSNTSTLPNNAPGNIRSETCVSESNVHLSNQVPVEPLVGKSRESEISNRETLVRSSRETCLMAESAAHTGPTLPQFSMPGMSAVASNATGIPHQSTNHFFVPLSRNTNSVNMPQRTPTKTSNASEVSNKMLPNDFSEVGKVSVEKGVDHSNSNKPNKRKETQIQTAPGAYAVSSILNVSAPTTSGTGTAENIPGAPISSMEATNVAVLYQKTPQMPITSLPEMPANREDSRVDYQIIATSQISRSNVSQRMENSLVQYSNRSAEDSKRDFPGFVASDRSTLHAQTSRLKASNVNVLSNSPSIVVRPTTNEHIRVGYSCVAPQELPSLDPPIIQLVSMGKGFSQKSTSRAAAQTETQHRTTEDQPTVAPLTVSHHQTLSCNQPSTLSSVSGHPSPTYPVTPARTTAFPITIYKNLSLQRPEEKAPALTCMHTPTATTLITTWTTSTDAPRTTSKPMISSQQLYSVSHLLGKSNQVLSADPGQRPLDSNHGKGSDVNTQINPHQALDANLSTTNTCIQATIPVMMNYPVAQKNTVQASKGQGRGSRAVTSLTVTTLSTVSSPIGTNAVASSTILPAKNKTSSANSGRSAQENSVPVKKTQESSKRKATKRRGKETMYTLHGNGILMTSFQLPIKKSKTNSANLERNSQTQSSTTSLSSNNSNSQIANNTNSQTANSLSLPAPYCTTNLSGHIVNNSNIPPSNAGAGASILRGKPKEIHSMKEHGKQNEAKVAIDKTAASRVSDGNTVYLSTISVSSTPSVSCTSVPSAAVPSIMCPGESQQLLHPLPQRPVEPKRLSNNTSEQESNRSKRQKRGPSKQPDKSVSKNGPADSDPRRQTGGSKVKQQNTNGPKHKSSITLSQPIPGSSYPKPQKVMSLAGQTHRKSDGTTFHVNSQNFSTEAILRHHNPNSTDVNFQPCNPPHLQILNVSGSNSSLSRGEVVPNALPSVVGQDNGFPTILNIFAPVSLNNMINLNNSSLSNPTEVALSSSLPTVQSTYSNFSAESLIGALDNQSLNNQLSSHQQMNDNGQNMLMQPGNQHLFTDFSTDTLLNASDSTLSYGIDSIMSRHENVASASCISPNWLQNSAFVTENSPIKSIMSILESTAQVSSGFTNPQNQGNNMVSLGNYLQTGVPVHGVQGSVPLSHLKTFGETIQGRSEELPVSTPMWCWGANSVTGHSTASGYNAVSREKARMGMGVVSSQPNKPGPSYAFLQTLVNANRLVQMEENVTDSCKELKEGGNG